MCPYLKVLDGDLEVIYGYQGCGSTDLKNAIGNEFTQ